MAGVRVQGTEMLWQGYMCKGLRCCGRGTCAKDYEMLWQGFVCKEL